ncbi:MAG TPA: hypothetical protein VF266_16205, partial [Thermoanaerobaculia bacterium]
MRIWRFAVAWFVVISLSAAERPPIYREESFGIRKDAPPVVAHEFTTPDVTLPAPTDLRPGGDPPIVGTVRPVAVHFAARTEPRSFRSEGATHVRLRLTNVSMPPDAIAWVIGASGSAAFGAELLHDRTLWTPSVEGDTITLSLPAGAQADVTAIAHIVAPRPVTNA